MHRKPFRRTRLIACSLMFAVMITPQLSPAQSQPGRTGRTYKDSVPPPPPRPQAPPGAPNVLFIVLDDVGFAQVGAFGADVIRTPNIDRLAARGLRFNNFTVNPFCSPSRASLLTGMNSHSVGFGVIAEMATGFPGYSGRLPKSSATLAEVLRANGYNTFAVGKWHLSSAMDATAAGPFETWPLGRGFEHFYGFLPGETNQWAPELWRDNTPVEPPARPGYHLTEDLVDQSIAYLRNQQQTAPDKPFFLYFATGAAHAPHHVPREFIEKYKGRFDRGWDREREAILARQKQMGLMPPDTALPARSPGVQPWDSLSAEQRRMSARMMETYAGFMEHTDYHIGRLLKAIEATGKMDNTMIVFLTDNGASREGREIGTFNENLYFNAIPETLQANLRMIDQWGSPSTYAHYPIGWALAGNTPFQRWKTTTHQGGVRVPLIIHWPKRIRTNGTNATESDRSAIRTQFHHVTDIFPTVLEAIGLQAPEVYEGVAQKPREGVSMLYSFNDPGAASPHRTQYYEVIGSRAIYQDGWRAVAGHDRDSGANFEADKWELYHVAEDQSESRDLAAQNPEKLKELQALWWQEAEKYQVLPLDDRGLVRFAIARQRGQDASGKRTTWEFYPNTEMLIEPSAPGTKDRSFTITAEVEIPKAGAEGVLFAEGGRFGGHSLFVQKGRLVYVYNYAGIERTLITSDIPVPTGRATLRYEFTKTGRLQGTGALFINGKKAGEAQLARTLAVRYTEGISAGRDHLTPVAESYQSPFIFSGRLEKVTLDLK